MLLQNPNKSNTWTTFSSLFNFCSIFNEQKWLIRIYDDFHTAVWNVDFEFVFIHEELIKQWHHYWESTACYKDSWLLQCNTIIVLLSKHIAWFDYYQYKQTIRNRTTINALVRSQFNLEYQMSTVASDRNSLNLHL